MGVSIFKLGDPKASWIETSEYVALVYFSVVASLDVSACWSLQTSSVCSSALQFKHSRATHVAPKLSFINCCLTTASMCLCWTQLRINPCQTSLWPQPCNTKIDKLFIMRVCSQLSMWTIFLCQCNYFCPTFFFALYTAAQHSHTLYDCV